MRAGIGAGVGAGIGMALGTLIWLPGFFKYSKTMNAAAVNATPTSAQANKDAVAHTLHVDLKNIALLTVVTTIAGAGVGAYKNQC